MTFFYALIARWHHARAQRPPTQHTPLRTAFRRPWPGTVRGLILWLFGWGFMVIGGINYLTTTIPEPTRSYLAFPLSIAPAVVYGCLFVIVGFGAVISSYCHFNRDKWGYKATALMSGLWGLQYVLGWLIYDASVRALGSSVLWILFCLILLTCQRVPKVVFHGREYDL